MYHIKFTLATLVFSLLLPMGAVESRTLKIVQVLRTAQTQTVQQRRNEAIRLNDVCVQYYGKGQFKEALEIFKKALAIHKQIGDEAWEVVPLNNIGEIYNALGEYSKAIFNHVNIGSVNYYT
jgi:tetratricopeptide (TPR) repeat protein